MKIVGVILIVAGILMLVFKGINFTKEKKVIDAGPIQVNAKEHKHVEWPTYAGILAIAGGIVLVVVDRKNR
jgi:uncharacterized membrane protein HdeD (DUF308 family)